VWSGGCGLRDKKMMAVRLTLSTNYVFLYGRAVKIRRAYFRQAIQVSVA